MMGKNDMINRMLAEQIRKSSDVEVLEFIRTMFQSMADENEDVLMDVLADRVARVIVIMDAYDSVEVDGR